jgi:hypothetical protein
MKIENNFKKIEVFEFEGKLFKTEEEIIKYQEEKVIEKIAKDFKKIILTENIDNDFYISLKDLNKNFKKYELEIIKKAINFKLTSN